MPGTESILESNPIIREDLARIVAAPLPWHRLENKKILITGGGGFLAAYLVKAILAANREYALHCHVYCVTRNAANTVRRLADYLDSADLSILEHDVSQPLPANFPASDFIIHSASQASPRYYGIDPVGTIAANTVGASYLLDYAVRSEAERFLFFSSGEVYGQPNDSSRLVAEQDFGYLDPMQVRACYAESKRLGETMCVSWHQQHKLHTNVVRPFHTYGPGVALDDGRVFADFVASVIARQDIVLKSDGMALRPFCYIADATVAFLRVLFEAPPAQAYNVGNPDAEISIRDLAALIAGLFPERGVKTRFEIADAGNAYLKSPVSRSCPDIAKIKALGWMPTTSLEDGFSRTIQSFL